MTKSNESSDLLKRKKTSHGVRSKVNQILKETKKMANQNMQYIQGPKMDWTEDAGLHQRFKDWREEVELLMDTVLSHIRNADTKMKFVTLWAGKEARTYLNTLEQDNRDSHQDYPGQSRGMDQTKVG